MGNYVAALSRHFKPNTTPADVSDFALFAEISTQKLLLSLKLWTCLITQRYSSLTTYRKQTNTIVTYTRLLRPVI